jgi:pumilio RNA-binding family
VLQKIIEVLPLASFRFILEEIQGQAATIARHRFGCRILCRLLEYAVQEPLLVPLLDEVLAEAGALSCHYYGHHVLEHMLEHGYGFEKHKNQIVWTIRGNMGKCAQDAHGSFLIEAAMREAMRNCSRDRQSYLEQGLCGEDLLSLACSRFGSHVVRAFLQLPGDASQQAFFFLRTHSAHLMTSKFGRHVLEDMGIDIAESTSEASA